MGQDDIDKFERKYLGLIAGVLLVLFFAYRMLMHEKYAESDPAQDCMKSSEVSEVSEVSESDNGLRENDEQC